MVVYFNYSMIRLCNHIFKAKYLGAPVPFGNVTAQVDEFHIGQSGSLFISCLFTGSTQLFCSVPYIVLSERNRG